VPGRCSGQFGHCLACASDRGCCPGPGVGVQLTIERVRTRGDEESVMPRARGRQRGDGGRCGRQRQRASLGHRALSEPLRSRSPARPKYADPAEERAGADPPLN
jgi:hypothetical protein